MSFWDQSTPPPPPPPVTHRKLHLKWYLSSYLTKHWNSDQYCRMTHWKSDIHRTHLWGVNVPCLIYCRQLRSLFKLQALVYNILQPLLFSYTIGPRKLSANEQFFVGAQTVVSLLQITQIIPDVCFIIYMMMNWCLMSSDVMRHIRDKLWPMPKHGAINLYVHGNQKAR